MTVAPDTGQVGRFAEPRGHTAAVGLNRSTGKALSGS